MPSNQYKILITKPCTKNWDTMQPTEVGRHCNSCKKDVVDFSVLSDDEVKNYLIKNIGKETCGRFYNHQIDRIKIVLPQNILHSKIARWKKFLVVFMICFGVQLFSIDVSLAQTQQSIDSLPVLDSTKQADTLHKEKSFIMGDGVLDSFDIENTNDTTKPDSLHLCIDTNMNIGSTIITDTNSIVIFSRTTMGMFSFPVEPPPEIFISGNIYINPIEEYLKSPFLNPPQNTTPKKPKIPNKNLPINNTPYLPEEIFTLNKRKKSK